MSMKYKELQQLRDNLKAIVRDKDAILGELTVAEGVYAVNQAKGFCKNDSPDIMNTGSYRNGWSAGKTARAENGKAAVDVYNDTEYAGELEYGFRSHFVPGHWAGGTFVYQPNDPVGGMYVGPKGGYVKGRYTLTRAVRRTLDTQNDRVKRKFTAKLQEYLDRGLGG